MGDNVAITFTPLCYHKDYSETEWESRKMFGNPNTADSYCKSELAYASDWTQNMHIPFTFKKTVLTSEMYKYNTHTKTYCNIQGTQALCFALLFTYMYTKNYSVFIFTVW